MLELIKHVICPDNALGRGQTDRNLNAFFYGYAGHIQAGFAALSLKSLADFSEPGWERRNINAEEPGQELLGLNSPNMQFDRPKRSTIER